MNKNFLAFLSFALLLFAQDASAADIWGQLGDKIDIVGCGLRNVGYVIAGLGLISVTLGAIFNKISWKTLGYIYLSCFILTFMGGIISFIGPEGSNCLAVTDPASDDAGSPENTEPPGDTKENPVEK